MPNRSFRSGDNPRETERRDISDSDAGAPSNVTKFLRRLQLGKILVRFVAIILIFIGALTMVSPIPFGFVLLAVGIALLISTSKAAARAIRGLRRRFPVFNTLMRVAARMLPKRFRDDLRRSDPDY